MCYFKDPLNVLKLYLNLKLYLHTVLVLQSTNCLIISDLLSFSAMVNFVLSDLNMCHQSNSPSRADPMH